MEEIWKDIKGYEGLYQVSNTGKVRSLDRYVKHSSNNGKRIVKGKILKLSSDKDKYLLITLHKDGKSKTYKVHRLVAQTFLSEKWDNLQVNHIDGNKINNNINNLELVTIKENIIHSYKIGLHEGVKHSNETKEKISKANKNKLAGSKNPRARKVICLTTGETFDYIKQAAEKYNITAHSISHCCRGIQNYCGKHPITKEKLVWKYLE